MDPLVMLLRDLQSTANRQHDASGNAVSAPLTWDALNQQLQTSGSPEISYDEFNARWESDPVLKQLVDRFDGRGLVIKTKGMGDQTAQHANPGQSSIHSTAMAATKRAFS